MSPEAKALLADLSIFIGLPLAAWLSSLVATKVSARATKPADAYRLIATPRIFFVLAGVLLLAWAVISMNSKPTDYLALASGLGFAIILYPLVSNIRHLQIGWGLLATAAQIAMVMIAAVCVAFVVAHIGQIEIPPLSAFQAASAVITWPVVALIGGIAFFSHISRILNELESLEIFGGKFNRRKKEIEEDVDEELITEPSTPEDLTNDIKSLPKGVRSQANRYRNIIVAWGVISKALTKLAEPKGGRADLKLIRENLKILSEQKVIDDNLANEAELLFAQRNGFKRREAKIEANEYRTYLERALDVAQKLAPILQQSIKPYSA